MRRSGTKIRCHKPGRLAYPVPVLAVRPDLQADYFSFLLVSDVAAANTHEHDTNTPRNTGLGFNPLVPRSRAQNTGVWQKNKFLRSIGANNGFQNTQNTQTFGPKTVDSDHQGDRSPSGHSCQISRHHRPPYRSTISLCQLV